MTFLQVFTTAVSLCALFMVYSFLRREKLKEKYSLLWILAILVMQAAIFFHRKVDRLAAFIGIDYPPSLYFFLAFLFLFVLVMHMSLVMSRLTKQNQVLAQRVAILEERTHPSHGPEGFSQPSVPHLEGPASTNGAASVKTG